MMQTEPIHPSLYRPVLLGGAERSLVIMEITAIVALLFGAGIHVSTVVLVVCYLAVFHPLLVWLTSKDPEISVVYLRSLIYRDYYPAAPSLHARQLAVQPSIPMGR